MSAAMIPPRRPGTARLFHTSDWHLGVQVRNESRAQDHDAVIAELVALATAAQPDVIVHTGDLFDGARPPMADLDRAIRALRALAEVAPVSLLAGNHDGVGTLQVLATALEDDLAVQLESGTWRHDAPCSQRVRVHHSLTRPERGLVATYPGREGVDVRLACVPFIHANRTLTDFGRVQEANATYLDSMRVIVDAVTEVAAAGLHRDRQVMVLASHLHLGGARVSSERQLTVSEIYAADEKQLPADYAYLALGHIHVPQAVAGGRGRYAGSILEVDFGEEGEDKRVLVVDCEPGRPAEITSVPLTAGRRLRRIAVGLGELADHAADLVGTIVEVTITGGELSSLGAEVDSLDAAVRSLLTGAHVIQVIDARKRKPRILTDPIGPEGGPPPTTGEALRAWLTGPGTKKLAEHAEIDAVLELFESVAASVANEDRPELAAAAALNELCGDL